MEMVKLFMIKNNTNNTDNNTYIYNYNVYIYILLFNIIIKYSKFLFILRQFT